MSISFKYVTYTLHIVSNMVKDDTKILLALHKIEDRLQEIAEILRVSHSDTIEAAQRKIIVGSPLRKKILDQCNRKNSVSKIASILGKSVQQISNNIVLLQNAGLVKEVRRGKEKFYVKVR